MGLDVGGDGTEGRELWREAVGGGGSGVGCRGLNWRGGFESESWVEVGGDDEMT